MSVVVTHRGIQQWKPNGPLGGYAVLVLTRYVFGFTAVWPTSLTVTSLHCQTATSTSSINHSVMTERFLKEKLMYTVLYSNTVDWRLIVWLKGNRPENRIQLQATHGGHTNPFVQKWSYVR